jgi:tRNA uridine 5-carboxymethylaminomethyl modification enzyme
VKPDDAARFPTLERFVARSLAYALMDPGVRLDEVLAAEPLLAACPGPWRDSAELDIKYAGYVKKQEIDVERVRRLEKLVIPRDFDFGRLEGVSREALEKFTTIRPHSVGQATRIPGVRNADIAVLIVYLTKKRG